MTVIIWYVCVSLPICWVLKNLVNEEKEHQGLLKEAYEQRVFNARAKLLLKLWMEDGYSYNDARRRANFALVEELKLEYASGGEIGTALK